MNNNNWSDEVNTLLEKMRKNSIELSERHRKNFYEFKGYSKYFDIPIIIVSVLSSSFSVGAGSFLNQELVSLATCGISMLVAILTSIKLYLQLDESIKKEFEMSKAFHTLALDLFKVLHLKVEQRNGNGLDYLNKKYSDYIKLVEISNLLRKTLKRDFLLEIDPTLISDDNSSIHSQLNIDTFHNELINTSNYEDEFSPKKIPNVKKNIKLDTIKEEKEEKELKKEEKEQEKEENEFNEENIV